MFNLIKKVNEMDGWMDGEVSYCKNIRNEQCLNLIKRQTDGRTDVRTDRPTAFQTDGRTDRQTDRW